jgi:hypothetical protein
VHDGCGLQEAVTPVVVFPLQVFRQAFSSFLVIADTLHSAGSEAKRTDLPEDITSSDADADFGAQQLTIQHPGGQGLQLAGLQEACAVISVTAKPHRSVKIISSCFMLEFGFRKISK